MKVFKSLKAKVALLGVCVALACGFSGAAYASSHNFGYTLPGFQENGGFGSLCDKGLA